MGAFGTVCVARREGRSTPVALKVINRRHWASPAVINRCRDEARILRLLSHPYIVRVEELLHVDNHPVVQMEWVQGMNLESLVFLESDGMPAAEAIELVRRVFVALDAAWHALDASGQPMRVIHRDLKPDNVLLSVDGDVKVVDFGIARGDFEDKESITLNMMLGARTFTAPERLDGGVDKPSGDAYSLGLLLFNLLTGKRMRLSLHGGQHREAVDHCLTVLDPPGLDGRQQQRIRHLISRLLAYSEDHRPPHAESARILGELSQELAADLPSYAREVVAPVFEAREVVDPRQHDGWENVAFLQQASDLVSQDLPRPPDEKDSDLRIRRFLATADWEANLPELYRLLDTYPDWTAEPFLEILRTASAPWWQFWRRGAVGAARVAACLDVLRHRPGQGRDLAIRLQDHSDPNVAAAARRLLS